jgi:uncharacterized membrane protein
VDEWIGKRGGGLLMAGGPRSFGAGRWTDTPVERMLPSSSSVRPTGTDPSTLEPTGARPAPGVALFEDERATRAAIRDLPESLGRTNWVR